MEEKKQIERMVAVLVEKCDKCVTGCSSCEFKTNYQGSHGECHCRKYCYAKTLYDAGCRFSPPDEPRKIVDVQEFYNDEGVNVLRTVWSDGTFTDQLRPELSRKKERTVVNVIKDYMQLEDMWKVSTIYSDGMVAVTYELAEEEE